MVFFSSKHINFILILMLLSINEKLLGQNLFVKKKVFNRLLLKYDK